MLFVNYVIINTVEIQFFSFTFNKHYSSFIKSIVLRDELNEIDEFFITINGIRKASKKNDLEV